MKRGFTLVEILVATGLLVILAVVGSTLFFSLMRASTKTKTLELVKQEGNYALSVMERMVRNAKRVNRCAADSLEIENPDGGETTFRFCSDPGLVASESGSLSCQQARLTSSKVEASGFFDCTPPAEEVDPWVVGIEFNLEWSQESPRLEETTAINFQTTVTVRNF